MLHCSGTVSHTASAIMLEGHVSCDVICKLLTERVLLPGIQLAASGMYGSVAGQLHAVSL